ANLFVSTDGLSFATTCNTRASADSYAGTLRNLIMDWMNETDAANAWPEFDLFPTVNEAYDSWRDGAFESAARAQVSLREFWSPEGDPDNDRLMNAEEALLGTDPISPDPFQFRLINTSTNFVVRWQQVTADRGVTLDHFWKNSMDPSAPRLTIGLTVVNRDDLIAQVGYRWREARLSRAIFPTPNRAFISWPVLTP
ncbi:MAG: hypothetical protein M3Y82_13895, partial [Verrucomicrobiota bacterium]|nr:hypothetical protein [Verrucomicrobiota bacterium]